LKTCHKGKCPEILEKDAIKPPSRNFFELNMKKPFDENVFMGKLVTWITKTDQSFSIVEDEHFRSLLDYLKPNVSMTARRTLMRRMSEIYDQQKDKLKKELHSFDSKLSITCDI
jgi:hypothetical protein